MNDNNITGELIAPAAEPLEHLHIDSSAIRRIGALTQAATAIQSLGNTHHLVLPEAFTHKDITAAIESALPQPSRKKGVIQLKSIDSFKQYVADHSNETATYIYADPESMNLTAVFNDHAFPADPQAGWRDFRASYTAELSREFSSWMKNNARQMEQEDFAIFLEDNIADVVEPSGDALLKIALTLQAKTEVNFSSTKRLDNGQVQLTYTENIDARAGQDSIEIPREFVIGLRLFKNGIGYKIKARLKYRLGAGKMKFWYELDRPESVIEDAFEDYIEKAKEPGVTVLIGKA